MVPAAAATRAPEKSGFGPVMHHPRRTASGWRVGGACNDIKIFH
jgi:hypothetical protein